jgi:hypothetical protein
MLRKFLGLSVLAVVFSLFSPAQDAFGEKDVKVTRFKCTSQKVTVLQNPNVHVIEVGGTYVQPTGYPISDFHAEVWIQVDGQGSWIYVGSDSITTTYNWLVLASGKGPAILPDLFSFILS